MPRSIDLSSNHWSSSRCEARKDQHNPGLQWHDASDRPFTTVHVAPNTSRSESLQPHPVVNMHQGPIPHEQRPQYLKPRYFKWIVERSHKCHPSIRPPVPMALLPLMITRYWKSPCKETNLQTKSKSRLSVAISTITFCSSMQGIILENSWISFWGHISKNIEHKFEDISWLPSRCHLHDAQQCCPKFVFVAFIHCVMFQKGDLQATEYENIVYLKSD